MISLSPAMFSHRQTISVLAPLAALFLAPLGAPAYEQSSYHVFELVESDSEETVDGRIALPADTFAEASEPSTSSAPVAVERSEFEIDFTQTIRNDGATDFNTGLSEFETSETTGTTDGAGESFGFGDSSFGTSTSAFGE